MQPYEAWGERWRACAHPLAHQFMEAACEKRSLVVLAADLPSVGGLVDLIGQVGPHVTALKTHVDMVEEFSMSEWQSVIAAAQSHPVKTRWLFYLRPLGRGTLDTASQFLY